MDVRFVQDVRRAPSYGRGMTPRMDAIGIVTADLAASLTFYRRLGLDIPDGAESAPMSK